MRVRGKHLVITAGLLGAVMTTALVRRDREPRYNGRSLSEWLHAARAGYAGYPSDPAALAEATTVIRQIGTNALPTLLKWVSYEPSKLKAKIRPFLRGTDHPVDAEDAFRILGPAAHPAIPDLTHLAITSSGDERVMRCARCLGSIGPEAVPALNAIISNYCGEARYYPIAVLAKFGTNAQSAVPVLIKCLNDQDPLVESAAVNVLGELALSPDMTIPALTARLQSAYPNVRGSAARGLARFGSAARPAMSQLQLTLLDSDVHVREEATNALRKIAPEVLTNAPAQ